VQVVNKVTEGRPHIVDMIKNNEISLIINTVEEKRLAINDSRSIRTSGLQARVTMYTTIWGAEAAAEGIRNAASSWCIRYRRCTSSFTETIPSRRAALSGRRRFAFAGINDE
jgi:hypothetical protein